MKKFIRPLIVVGILGVIFAPQVMPFIYAVFYPVSEWQKDAEEMRAEGEKKNCHQIINAKYCTAPVDRTARWQCSNNLTDFNCSKYIDVGYLILEEHQHKTKELQKPFYWQTTKVK